MRLMPVERSSSGREPTYGKTGLPRPAAHPTTACSTAWANARDEVPRSGRDVHSLSDATTAKTSPTRAAGTLHNN